MWPPPWGRREWSLRPVLPTEPQDTEPLSRRAEAAEPGGHLDHVANKSPLPPGTENALGDVLHSALQEQGSQSWAAWVHMPAMFCQLCDLGRISASLCASQVGNGSATQAESLKHLGHCLVPRTQQPSGCEERWTCLSFSTPKVLLKSQPALHTLNHHIPSAPPCLPEGAKSAVSICQGCCNNAPHTGGSSNRSLSSPRPEATSLRFRHAQGWYLLRQRERLSQAPLQLLGCWQLQPYHGFCLHLHPAPTLCVRCVCACMWCVVCGVL